MARLYLVAYDVTHKKRWRKAYRIVREYFADGQYSCYECWLTPKERSQLEKQLRAVLSSDDALLIAPIQECRSDHIYLGVAEQAADIEFQLVG